MKPGVFEMTPMNLTMVNEKMIGSNPHYQSSCARLGSRDCLPCHLYFQAPGWGSEYSVLPTPLPDWKTTAWRHDLILNRKDKVLIGKLTKREGRISPQAVRGGTLWYRVQTGPPTKAGDQFLTICWLCRVLVDHALSPGFPSSPYPSTACAE